MIQVVLQLVISGVAMGFIYSLVAMEFTLIYNSSNLVNFAHDKFIMLGAYIFAGTFIIKMGINPVIAIVLTIIVMAIFGAVVAVGIFNPLRNMYSDIFAIMGTIMLAKILTEAVRLLWGPNPFAVKDFLGGTITMNNLVIAKANIYIIIASLIIVFGLNVFLKKTKLGKAMRCVAQNNESSALMGINVSRTIQISVAISSMICAVIGILIIPIFNVDSSMASTIGLKGFAAGVIGGFGSLPGAIVGGLFIGIIENISIVFLPAVYKDVIAFVLLILFLIIKPLGILGKISD